MPPPKRCRQWDIYKANIGEPRDVWLLVLSSTETNEIIESTIAACEIVPQAVHKPAASPLNLPAGPPDTGLEWPATVSVMTLASIPRNCLVSLEGRLEPAGLRAAALKGLGILFGTESWP